MPLNKGGGTVAQQLIISQGSFEIFFFRRIAGAIMIAAILLLLWPLMGGVRRAFEAR